MTKAKPSPMKLALKELKNLMCIASWRDRLYSHLSWKYDLKESIIRDTASKAGQTKDLAFLKHTFPPKKKKHLLMFA